MLALCILISNFRSVHEITLRHRQYFCGFAAEKPAIDAHFVGFWVNLHTRGSFPSRSGRTHRTLGGNTLVEG